METKQAKRISILLVPEDKTEPYSFRIKTSLVKLLYVAGAILLVHIILGVVFYFKYFQLMDHNKQISAYNAQLQEDNKRVLALAEQVNVLEHEYKKVRTLLGVERGLSPQTNTIVETPEPSTFIDKILPAVSIEDYREIPVESDRPVIVMSKTQRLHDSSENMPTLLPVKGFLTQDFQKEGWFAPQQHTGIDIVAQKGTVIRAAGTGIVIFANWTVDLGNLIILDHGGGILSFYGHNQRFLKPEKSYVKKGEPIALLGTSGRSSGPHLHFEVWKDGVPVDPKEYIPAFSESIRANF
jgi:murein DD-endopeptidase MepM/ murein hydrolase activator NlpD